MSNRNHTKKQIRIFALLLAVAVFLGGFSSLIRIEEAQIPRYLGNYDSDPIAQRIQDRLYSGIMERKVSIDLSDISVPLTQFRNIWFSFHNNTPDLYMVSNGYSYNSKIKNGICYITKFWPNYLITAEDQANAQLIWADNIQSIVAGRNPNWNSMQTALYFHDYLALNSCYDHSYTYYDAYNILTKNTGVCKAYTMAYDALLSAVGIQTDYISSDSMDHCWNRVFIGGNQYNVDVTWDDPSQDRLGQVRHQHFLVSDSVLDDNHQYTWDEGYGKCNDTSYDDAFWKDVNTAFIPVGDEFFFIYKGSFYKWTADNRLVKCVSLSSKWYTDSRKNRWWLVENSDGSKTTNFSVLWPAGDKILYNATSSIKTFDPKTNKLATVYTYKGKGNICGFSYDGSTLTLQVGYNPWTPQECEIITITDFYVS